MRTKKFENPAKLFVPSAIPSVRVQTDTCQTCVVRRYVTSVGMRADGHVSDMRGPSVMPSVSDVGNAVCNRANRHVSDMPADNPSVIPSVLASENPLESRR